MWGMFISLALAAEGNMAPPQAVVETTPVVADQPIDTVHPPDLRQVRYLTGGVEVPARLFVASGAGPKPTVLLLHGFPGTELNLDLARALQRAGWNVLAIHYRGVWGAPGQFSFTHTVEDARAALTWLRDPQRTELIDPTRIVVMGHSMGGFDTVMVGDDPKVAGFITLSAADIGGMLAPLAAPDVRESAREEWEADTSFTNMSYDAMVDEAQANQSSWDWDRNAAEMAGRPVLIVDSNDGLEKDGDAVAKAIIASGGPNPTRVKFETDHSYNDHRVALASTVVRWVLTNFPMARPQR